MRLLLTGATGKLGQAFLARFLAEDRFADWQVVAICNNRMLDPMERVCCVSGSIADAGVVARAMDGTSHVVHMAAVKESPELAIDVAVKGMFLLLEAMRKSATARQFILIGGDCSVGHIFHAYDAPITEKSPRRAYPGCYALTKVIEEVMLEQYQIQYGLNGCCLRAPWIMEKDDFRFALAFGPDQFGGPPWSDLIDAETEADYARRGAVPLMLDHTGNPLKRNFVHASDVANAVLAAIDCEAARGQLFNIAMNRPVDYGEVAMLTKSEMSLEAATIATPFFSNWLDNAKARQLLSWEPAFDLRRLIKDAWAYVRPANEPRKIWYPG